MNQESLAMTYGITSALVWGAADFSGGFATRRSHVLTVILFSQIVGAVFLLGIALYFNEPFPSFSHIALGGLAGIFGVLGLMALYRGLATGRMGIVAPVSAVITAMIPILYGWVIEGMPKAAQLLGFAAALLSVWLLSYSEDTSKIKPGELYLPVMAGLGFGLFFIFIDCASSRSVLWPLVGTRIAAITLTTTLFLLSAKPAMPRQEQLPFIVLAGIFDVMGNAFFALAARLGRLDISAMLSSLYPAATVILAWLFLKERIGRRQWLGVATALVSLGLIAS